MMQEATGVVAPVPAAAAARPAPAATATPDGPRTILAAVWRWPLTVRALAVALAVVYGPLLFAAGRVWLDNENQAHGAFVLPAVVGLLWMLRREVREASTADAPSPAAGLTLLGGALAVECLAHVLGLEAVPLATLPFALLGAVLALCGRATARVVRFPLLFLLFAVPVPDAVVLPLSAHVQRVSTDAAAFTLTTAGVPLAQSGNRLDTPTLSVEVAEVCSGFKKLTALVAFSLLYGFAYSGAGSGVGWGKRLALFAATYPVAVAVNCLRICALVGIGMAWGQGALEKAHDGAEIAVLLVAFALFVAFGKGIGCRELRFRP